MGESRAFLHTLLANCTPNAVRAIRQGYHDLERRRIAGYGSSIPNSAPTVTRTARGVSAAWNYARVTTSSYGQMAIRVHRHSSPTTTH